jgi:hypothetical protein
VISAPVDDLVDALLVDHMEDGVVGAPVEALDRRETDVWTGNCVEPDPEPEPEPWPEPEPLEIDGANSESSTTLGFGPSVETLVKESSLLRLIDDDAS